MVRQKGASENNHRTSCCAMLVSVLFEGNWGSFKYEENHPDVIIKSLLVLKSIFALCPKHRKKALKKCNKLLR